MTAPKVEQATKIGMNQEYLPYIRLANVTATASDLEIYKAGWGQVFPLSPTEHWDQLSWPCQIVHIDLGVNIAQRLCFALLHLLG